jgi:hypothetical protein
MPELVYYFNVLFHVGSEVLTAVLFEEDRGLVECYAGLTGKQLQTFQSTGMP